MTGIEPILSMTRFWLLFLAIVIAGCGGESSEMPAGASPDEPAGASELTDDNADSSPAEPLSETDKLIADLSGTLSQLEQNQPEILNALKQYRVELAQRLADLRSSLARSGKSLDEIRTATGPAASETNTLRIRRVDRRCSELRVYIGKLEATRDRLALLVEDHQYVLTDLQTKKRVDQLIDPALLEKARSLLEKAGDQNELSPQNILENPELVVAMADAEKATAEAISNSILPERPEKSLDDLPALPTLDFETSGQAEMFLLDDLGDHLATGKAQAEQHLTASRPEAAIESFHEALQQVRKAVEAYPQPVTWKDDCLKQITATETALSEQLAGPYLNAVEKAIPEARKSANWDNVLDLLEAVVRLAPKAEKLPEALQTISTILDYRKNTDDFDAVVAWERLQEIKALHNGTPYRPVSFRSRARRTSGAGDSSNNQAPLPPDASLFERRQHAQNQVARAIKRWRELEATVETLQRERAKLLETKVATSQIVRDKNDEIAHALTQQEAQSQVVRTAAAARDETELALWNDFDRQIAGLRQEIARLTDPNGIGDRPDAPSVKRVESQIASIEQTRARYRPGVDRAQGKSELDLTAFLADLTNSVAIYSTPGRSPGDVKQITVKGVGTRWRWIPPATFLMGEERIATTISQGFWMLETEVTQGLWSAVMGSGLDWSDYGTGPSYPVYNVRHDEAVSFCRKLNELLKLIRDAEGLAVRLPTEAEWEHAARAGTTTAYFWGDSENQIGRYAWYDDNANSSTHSVGKKLPNAWGLYDIAGNVWEWCGDWYDGTLQGGADPRGASSGSYRVDRGGSWRSSAWFCRSAFRGRDAPSYRFRSLGFRVATVPEVSGGGASGE